MTAGAREKIGAISIIRFISRKDAGKMNAGKVMIVVSWTGIGPSFIRNYHKNVFWPNLFVGAEF
jgi:hypothetical protein